MSKVIKNFYIFGISSFPSRKHNVDCEGYTSIQNKQQQKEKH